MPQSEDVYACCGEQPTHIFLYENEKIFTICKTHFNSESHRFEVKHIIDYKTGKKLDVEKIFAELEVGTL